MKNLHRYSAALFGFASISFAAQAEIVNGVVLDDLGETVIGATIMEKGTTNGTITDFDGNFTIDAKSDVIVVSYVGMKSQEINIKGKSNVKVTLASASQDLDEVVVIGYGTVSKRDLTGSVASVSAKQLSTVPVANATEALQGKMAGVQITATEGSPDAEVKIRVRGGGSLSQDNSPLYIVDGFPVSSISDIAPSDIQSVDVLKDASSTAIYGAQGANGVVIITTKSGKEGKTEVNFGASYGIRKVAGSQKMLSPYEFALWQHEIRPDALTYGRYEDLEIYKSMKGTDYQDQLFGRTGNQANYNLSVSGGNKDMKYSVSYAHNEEKAIMIGSGFTKDNINAKITTNLNKWLTVDFNGRMSYQTIDGLAGGADSNQSNKSYSAVARAAIFRPIAPLSELADDDDENVNNNFTPVEVTEATYKEQTRFQQNYNAGLNWTPIKGLRFRTEFGYGFRYNNTDQVWDYQATANSKLGKPGLPQAQMVRDITKNWRVANTVTYDKKKLFNVPLNLNVLLGQEASSSQNNRTRYSATGFEVGTSIDNILASLGSGTNQNISTYIGLEDNMTSFFGRLNLGYTDRYLLTVTMRADGSSRFTEGNRWGYFPSAALAWRINEEEWMQGTEGWLSNLKARLSYGMSGNNRIDATYMYKTYSLKDGQSGHIYFDNNGEANVIEHNNILANPNLKWETTTTRNFGVDFGFMRNRFNGSVDLYWNTTDDLLMKTAIPTHTGYSYQYRNFGQTSNKGVEFAFDAALIEKKNFNMNFNFNVAYNRGKIESLNGMSGYFESSNAWSSNDRGCTNDFWIEEGGRIGEVWGYKYDGVYSASDLVYDTSKKTWSVKDGVLNSSSLTGTLMPGAMKLQDTNNDGVIDENDKVRLGNTVHPVNGGFGFNGNFKNFDFNIFCNYSLGGKVVNYAALRSSYFAGSSANWNLNSNFALANRWTMIDPVTGISMKETSFINGFADINDYYAYIDNVNAGKTFYNPSTATNIPLTDQYVEDASFLRINTVSLGYTLPKKFTQKLHLNNVRVFATGYNLFVFTKYSGVDPEVDCATSTPLTPGVDYASYPKSRSFVGGINVTF